MELSRHKIAALALAGIASAALAVAAGPAMAQSGESHLGIPVDRIGVVGFTFREQIGQDARATLQSVTECGIENIEFSGPDLAAAVPSFQGVEVPALKAFAEEFDFNIPSLGVNGEDLVERLDVVISAAKELGASFVRISGAPEIEGEASVDYHTRLAALLNEAGAALKAEGITLAYHNHDEEFVDMGDGRRGYDVLLAEVDPANAVFELDLYWSSLNGNDPLKLIQDNPGRFKLFHVKDAQTVTTNGVEETTFATVGQGFIDFQSIFDLSDTAGVEYYFIENDRPQPDGVTSTCEGYAYLSSATEPS